MNQSQAEGKWTQVKGEIRRMWGKLTDSEVEESKGNLQTLSGKIQEKFGDAKEDVSAKLNELYDKHRFDPSTDYNQSANKASYTPDDKIDNRDKIN